MDIEELLKLEAELRALREVYPKLGGQLYRSICFDRIVEINRRLRNDNT